MKRGRPRGTAKEMPTEFDNRFTKFYFLNRERLNKERHAIYKARKEAGICVRCKKDRYPKSRIFCAKHHEMSRRQPTGAK